VEPIEFPYYTPPHYHDQIYLSNYSAIFTNVDGADPTLNQGWPIKINQNNGENFQRIL